jgi:diadenosine tetraphosphatase ApaH/serine/threonine PP2A family protein phosphatase
MRIAIISDIHSNLPAFESVLARIDSLNVDKIHCLGDLVGYGPFPNETIALARNRCELSVKGNHDSGVLGETPIDQFNPYGQAGIRWTVDNITDDNLTFLRSLPLVASEPGITFVHASPGNPSQWTYVLTMREALESFRAFDTQYCFIGHTHLPLVIGEDRSINRHTLGGKRYLINVGSVGQPRDGISDAAFGIFDTEADEYSLHRVPYDVRKTIQAIKNAGLPSFLGKRLLKGT